MLRHALSDARAAVALAAAALLNRRRQYGRHLYLLQMFSLRLPMLPPLGCSQPTPRWLMPPRLFVVAVPARCSADATDEAACVADVPSAARPHSLLPPWRFPLPDLLMFALVQMPALRCGGIPRCLRCRRQLLPPSPQNAAASDRRLPSWPPENHYSGFPRL